MRLFLREANDCKAGTFWYVCNAPAYRGCCSVDACHRGGCPDDTATKSIEPSITFTASIVDSKRTSSATESITTSSFISSASTSIPASSTITSVSSINQTPSYTATVSSTRSSTLPVESAPALVSTGSSSRQGTIIGGSVAGVVALTLVACLFWFCCWKRKNGRSPKSKFTEPLRPTYREMNAEEVQRLSPHDVFAPFGGYPRSNPVEERSTRNASISSQNTVIINRAARPVSEMHEEDAPIRDMEKSSLSAPPLDDHPAMHPLPGQSPEVPAYHPGQEITSPEIAQHPAYLAKHPSLVNRYIARSSTTDPASANLRSHPKSNPIFPFMTFATSSRRGSSESKPDDALSTLPSQKRRNRLSKTFSRFSYTPIPTTHSSPIEQTQSTVQNDKSPIPGRSELPAIVPQELSSTPTNNLTGHLDMFKVAAERRMHCSPTSVKTKSPIKSNSPLYKSIITPPPFIPSQNIKAYSEENLRSPTAPSHPSPRSADSPALNSDFYQSHIVSPEFASSSGKFVAYGHTFDRKPHVSLMQMPASRSSPPRSLRHHASFPQTPSPPPQRPRIDTGMNAAGTPKGKANHRDCLGKGTENVMSWATYSNASTLSLPSTPPRNARDIPAALRIPQIKLHKKDEEEEESPILPPFFSHPGRGSVIFVHGKEMPERWSGSTAAVEPPTTKDEQADIMSSDGVIDKSPRVYPNDGEEHRYSEIERPCTNPNAPTSPNDIVVLHDVFGFTERS